MNRISRSGKQEVVEERELPDAVVLERSVADPHLFTLVFERHYRTVYGYLSRRVGRTVADDLAAETFVRAFERRASYDRSLGRALPWLFGISLNLLAHHRRSEARQLRALASATPDETSASGDLTAGISDPGVRRRLVAALEQLDDYDREALLLYAWGELRYDEIAAVLRIPVGTVRSRLNRARRKVRAALEADEGDNVVQLRREEASGG